MQGRSSGGLNQEELLRWFYVFLPLSFINLVFATTFERRFMTKDALSRMEEMKRKAEGTRFGFRRRAILNQVQQTPG